MRPEERQSNSTPQDGMIRMNVPASPAASAVGGAGAVRQGLMPSGAPDPNFTGIFPLEERVSRPFPQGQLPPIQTAMTPLGPNLLRREREREIDEVVQKAKDDGRYCIVVFRLEEQPSKPNPTIVMNVLPSTNPAFPVGDYNECLRMLSQDFSDRVEGKI